MGNQLKTKEETCAFIDDLIEGQRDLTMGINDLRLSRVLSGPWRNQIDKLSRDDPIVEKLERLRSDLGC